MNYWVERAWEPEAGDVWLVVTSVYHQDVDPKRNRLLDLPGVFAITKTKDTAQVIVDSLTAWVQVDRAE